MSHDVTGNNFSDSKKIKRVHSGRCLGKKTTVLPEEKQDQPDGTRTSHHKTPRAKEITAGLPS